MKFKVMKHIYKLFLCAIFLQLSTSFMLGANGDEFSFEGINYEIISEDEGTCKTKSSTFPNSGNPSENLTGILKIPSTVVYEGRTFKVTEIGDYSFFRNSNLTGLILSNGIKIIGESAFSGCNGLIGTLDIPSTVIEIKKQAFYSCSSLEELNFLYDYESNLEKIGEGCFVYNNKLKGTVFLNFKPGSNGIIGNLAFDHCNLDVVILHNCYQIGKQAFLKSQGSLSHIILNTDTPPKLSDNDADYDPDYDNFYNSWGSALVYVPIGSKRNYWASSGWNKFKYNNIIETDFNPEYLTINPNEILLDLTENNSVQLNADIAPSFLKNLVSWEIEDGNEIINIDSSGKVTATKQGIAIVKGSCGNLSAYCKITVKEGNSLNLQIDDFSIEVGKIVEIPVNILSESSANNFSYSGFQFDVALPEGVSISDVKANSALSGFKAYKNEIEANKTRIMVIDASNLSSSSLLDEVVTLTFKAEKNAKAMEGATYPISNAVFFINQTEGEEIKGIDSEYKITVVNVPMTEGDVTITPSPRDDNDNLPEGDENKRAANEIYVDETLTYSAVVAEKITSPEIKWTVTEGNEYISITDKGQNSIEVKGLKIGEGKIRLSSEAYPDFSMEYAVKVIPMPVKSVTVSADGTADLLNIKAGSEVQLKAVVEPAEKYTGEVEVNWSSSTPAVATVGNENADKGLLKALKIGETTVNATVNHKDAVAKSRYKTFKKGDARVKVVAADLQSVTVNAVGGSTSLKAGESAQLEAVVTPGEEMTGEVAVSWSSSNPEVISVSGEGLATALKYDANPVTITARVVKAADKEKADAKYVEGKIELITAIRETESIVITSVSLEEVADKTDLKATEWLYLTATVLPANATNKEIEWSVSPDDHIDIELNPDDNGDNTMFIAKVRDNVVNDNVVITATVKGTGVSNSITVNIAELIPGDADDDLTVDVADAITTGHWIVGNKADNFCLVNADTSNDRQISVADLTDIIDIALHWGDTGYNKTVTRSYETPMVAHDALMASMTCDEKNVWTIEVAMTGYNEYKALQADIVIPEGLEVTAVATAEKAGNHSIISNIDDDGLLKVVLFSLTNSMFDTSAEVLFRIKATGSLKLDDIFNIENIYAVGTDNREYSIGYEGMTISEEAGAAVITDNFDSDTEIYNLQGIRIKNTETLLPGIYIINGNKTIIR